MCIRDSAQAGQPRRVTVATNMAGRGTDIKLHPKVKKSGGLHVILAGIHTSLRIDRQLIGRVARQGDPGSYRKILCLNDDLLDEAFTTSVAEALRTKLRASFSISRCLDLFNKAQRRFGKKASQAKIAFLQRQEKPEVSTSGRLGSAFRSSRLKLPATTKLPGQIKLELPLVENWIAVQKKLQKKSMNAFVGAIFLNSFAAA